MTKYIKAETILGIQHASEDEVVQSDTYDFETFFDALPTLKFGEVIFCKITEEQSLKIKEEYGIN